MVRISIFFTGLIIGLLGACWYLSYSIDNKVNMALTTKIDEFDKGLVAKLKLNSSLLQEIVAESYTQSQEIKSTASWLASLRMKAENNLSLMRAEADTFSINKKEYPQLSDPEGCQANRGAFGTRISFQRPFSSPPELMVSLSTLDFAHGEDHRIRVKVKEVTSEYFVVDLVTWCDTRTSQAEINWLAIGL